VQTGSPQLKPRQRKVYLEIGDVEPERAGGVTTARAAVGATGADEVRGIRVREAAAVDAASLLKVQQRFIALFHDTESSLWPRPLQHCREWPLLLTLQAC
jgi:hypothetical protein